MEQVGEIVVVAVAPGAPVMVVVAVPPAVQVLFKPPLEPPPLKRKS
jgi:hypothetical protein